MASDKTGYYTCQSIHSLPSKHKKQKCQLAQVFRSDCGAALRYKLEPGSALKQLFQRKSHLCILRDL